MQILECVTAGAGAEDAPVVVMLHGYGSNERDLVALAPLLGGVECHSLRGPKPAPFGFSWFALNAKATRMDELIDRSPAGLRSVERGADSAADAVLAWADENVPNRPLVLLGFSQGGAVAAQLTRRAPERIRALVMLSSFVPLSAAEEWRDLADGLTATGDAALAERAVPIFSGRGDQDPVIPPELVAVTDAWLTTHENVTRRVYPGLAHAVSDAEIADVAAFLAANI